MSSDNRQNKASRKFFHLNTRFAKTLWGIVVTAILGFAYFYAALPAINLHAAELYFFIVLLCIIFFIWTVATSGINLSGAGPREYLNFVKSQCFAPAIIIVALIVLGIAGSVAGATLFRSGAYSRLLTVQTGDFAREVDEISYDKIPMLDKESAQRLGDRKMGELADMVSQFEVAEDYTQINYNDRPVRVTPLVYGDIIKWITNRRDGIPAYLIIDMATQEVEVVRLQNGIKYTTAEHFGRHLNRYLRFRYPTFMFDRANFEIDEEGVPYWVCPKVEKTIGLFGGTDINGAVLVNAITGEHAYYPKDEVPTWVDRVYTAELIIQQYDYHGMYQNGFFNSIFGQKNVTVTTDGYNYIALNDDVYVYTGITSVSGDQSNIGFILSNQRTKETRFYTASGAAEYSAMASAEGVVQHLGYRSTFPLLLNVSGQPTYFMSLKDNARLVKMYAMVNVAQYQIVATGTNVADCEREYIRLLTQHKITEEIQLPETQVTGIIDEIRTAVKDGNTFYYIRFRQQDYFYALSAADSEIVVTFDPGDEVLLEVDPTAEGAIRSAYDARLIKAAPAAVPAPVVPAAEQTSVQGVMES
jgi:hypothetical protein